MKSLMIFLVTIVLGISLTDKTQGEKPTTYSTTNTKETNTNDSRIDFMLGNWIGTGFVTDANGLQQYIEIQEDNLRISNDEYQMVGIAKNPGNSFMHSFNKTLFFNNKMNAWYTKGTINDNTLHDSRTILSDNNVISYSYYDLNSVLVRYTIARETDDSYTEIEEKWGANGWDKTAWFRMKRNYDNKNSTARPLR